MNMKIIFGDQMTEEEQIKFINVDPVKNIWSLYTAGIIPTIATQKTAIVMSAPGYIYNAFSHIINPSLEIQLFAMQVNGNLIGWLTHPISFVNPEPIIPSPMIQFAAVKQTLDAIRRIPQDILDPGVKAYWEKEGQIRQSGS